MMEDLHERARRLIAAKGVEGISTNHQAWLDAHLEGCSACAEMAEAVERAIRTLRSVTVQVNTELVDRTRRVVQLRAHELRGRQAQLIPIWMSCALSWLLGGLTLPLVWRLVEWVGLYVKLPDDIWVLVLVLWWTLPTLAAAALLTAKGSQVSGDR
jgi:predicted anti-sigma-YlaC factor YlaD